MVKEKEMDIFEVRKPKESRIELANNIDGIIIGCKRLLNKNIF